MGSLAKLPLTKMKNVQMELTWERRPEIHLLSCDFEMFPRHAIRNVRQTVDKSRVEEGGSKGEMSLGRGRGDSRFPAPSQVKLPSTLFSITLTYAVVPTVYIPIQAISGFETRQEAIISS